MDRTQSQWIIDKRPAVAEHGMVTAMHPLAAAAGVEILRAGGNAVDAAVATAFTIGVVEPAMSGVGGVAAMVICWGSDGHTVVVDGSSAAPAGAREDTFELASPDSVGGMYGWRGTLGDVQNTGYRAPVVPGQPACLLHAHERYGSGRLSRAQVMAPAIRLAEEGFAVDPYQAQTIAFAQRRLRAYPETVRTFFMSDGTPPVPATMTRDADRLVQTDLAQTLHALAKFGPAALYEGDIGERVVADLHAHGGLISRDDLASYRVREHRPGLATTYRGYRLVGLSVTSGSMTAFEALNILRHFPLAEYGPGSPIAVHLIAEACRRAFLDRFAYLADPDQQPVPIEGLLSAEYAEHIAATIALDRAQPSAGAGDPWRYGRASGLAATPTAGGVSAGDGCTTHLNVVDADHNVVALTSTLGEAFGSGVVARGTGILLNNGMTWFDPEPGHVNSINSRKRILWAPTPTVVLSDGQPLLGIGAPGGRRIISALVQSLVNILDFGLSVQAAVTPPRIHCEGAITEVDGRAAGETIAGLTSRGHDVKLIEENSSSFRFARPGGIRIDPQTGLLHGGVHQFTPAWAIGY